MVVAAAVSRTKKILNCETAQSSGRLMASSCIGAGKKCNTDGGDGGNNDRGGSATGIGNGNR